MRIDSTFGKYAFMAGDKALGSTLRRLRKERNLHLIDVAKPAGIGASALSQIERGEKGTSIKRLRLIAKALGVDMMDLLGRERRAS